MFNSNSFMVSPIEISAGAIIVVLVKVLRLLCVVDPPDQGHCVMHVGLCGPIRFVSSCWNFWKSSFFFPYAGVELDQSRDICKVNYKHPISFLKYFNLCISILVLVDTFIWHGQWFPPKKLLGYRELTCTYITGSTCKKASILQIYTIFILSILWSVCSTTFREH